MTWFLLAIVPPFLWSIVNHTDKYLLSRAHHKSSVEVLIVYSTGFSLIVLPLVYWFARNDLFTNFYQVVIQIVGGVLLSFSLYFYFKALFKDEASIVTPLFLLVPVFGYVLSHFFLAEALTGKQLFACILIMLGTLVLSLEFKEESGIRIRVGVLFLMIGCTFAQALQETLFKVTTIEQSFATSLFWLHVGTLVFCAGLIMFKRWILKDFFEAVRINGPSMFSVNFFNETISALAYGVRNYAILLAPIVVVMTLNGFQPAFVFILGTVLTLLFPKYVHEKIKPIHLAHKGIAVAIMVIGSILIAQTL